MRESLSKEWGEGKGRERERRDKDEQRRRRIGTCGKEGERKTVRRRRGIVEKTGGTNQKVEISVPGVKRRRISSLKVHLEGKGRRKETVTVWSDMERAARS